MVSVGASQLHVDHLTKPSCRVRFVDVVKHGRKISRKEWLLGQQRVRDLCTQGEGALAGEMTFTARGSTEGGQGGKMRWESNNRFSLLDGDGDNEEQLEAELDDQTLGVTVGLMGALGARKASKLWSTVRVGPPEFLPVLLHLAVHLSQDRLVGMVEQQLMTNLPPSLTLSHQGAIKVLSRNMGTQEGTQMPTVRTCSQ